MTTTDIPYVVNLRHELVGAIERQRVGIRSRPSWRRRFAIVAVAALVAIAAPVVASLVLRQPSVIFVSGALAIERTRADTYTVRLLELRPDAAQLNRDLARAGIDARVETAPASPSLVGKWVGGTMAGGDLPDVTPDTATIPVGARGVVLLLGRPPERDEQAPTGGSMFAPGEPLYCSGIERLSPRDAHRALVARGYDRVTWASSDGQQLAGPPDAGVIVGAQPSAPNGVHVLVASLGAEDADQHGLPEQDCGT